MPGRPPLTTLPTRLAKDASTPISLFQYRDQSPAALHKTEPRRHSENRLTRSTRAPAHTVAAQLKTRRTALALSHKITSSGDRTLAPSNSSRPPLPDKL